jgi:hypothetical protein
MRLPRVWGATDSEIAATYPCDAYRTDVSREFYRAVTVETDPATLFGWLCQLRAAPYSYDLVDNFGRRSPRTRDPELERLEVGQRMMTIFRLDSFEPDRQITVVMDRAHRLFGEVAVTYAVRPVAPQATRLVAKLVIDVDPVRAALLGWGDLLMMRKQLLNLKSLAESESPIAR